MQPIAKSQDVQCLDMSDMGKLLHLSLGILFSSIAPSPSLLLRGVA